MRSNSVVFPWQIRNILKQGIETPEDQNDLRKMQLRELARLNGTLREDDNRLAMAFLTGGSISRRLRLMGLRDVRRKAKPT